METKREIEGTGGKVVVCHYETFDEMFHQMMAELRESFSREELEELAKQNSYGGEKQ